MDPVINMIFRAVAGRLKEVNDKVNNISDRVISDLACRIFFDGLLHPVPSSTVLKYIIGKSLTEVDNAIEAYWINTTLKQNPTFYFAPVEQTTLFPAEAVLAIGKNAEGAHLLWTNPQWKGRNQILMGFENAGVKRDSDEKDCLYLALRAETTEVKAPNIFIESGGELRDLIRWSRWRFVEKGGALGAARVPGNNYIERLAKKRAHHEITLWGYGYFPYEHKEEYDELFFDLMPGETGPPPAELRKTLKGQKEDLWSATEPLYWIQIEFDRHIPTNVMKSFEFAATNCVVAINSHFQKQSFYYHGPGSMAIELQMPARNLYDIVSLDDNHGRVYQNIYAAQKAGDNDCRYVPRIEGDTLKLIVSPPKRGPMPDRFAVSYRISSGEAANGISPGLINSLYNPFPGIESVLNLTDSKGGVDARSFDEMVATFPQVLRSRNRAIVVSDYQALALAFDSRIKTAIARRGSAVRNGLLARSVEVGVNLGNFRFSIEEEARLFAARLERYLEIRSPIGTVVVVRII
ncbi:MAG TPA: hypothetical protein DCZ43_06465 [candidate division Zixibacteria bacterium]|nr:hypothetical protein [candidate division Zixibacteria bacterium]